MIECDLGRLLVSCDRGFERDATSEAWWVLSTLFEHKTIDADLTEVPGLVYIKVDTDPRQIMGDLREFLVKNLNEIRYCLKFIPIQDWCKTDLNLICRKVAEKSNEISDADRWRIVLNKRYNSLKREDIIKQVALQIPQGKVDLNNPNKIVRIEIVGKKTGISIHQPDQIISIEKLRKNRGDTNQ
ncbi:MAG: THUMP domain-containing protein [Candidatus Hodarchaeota archaeon]